MAIGHVTDESGQRMNIENENKPGLSSRYNVARFLKVVIPVINRRHQ
ncbi:MAG: hypothetical protein AB2669_18095 [Candidatus Thiodiazotropha endolucinida]|nr:hypothetical protein [Candidatus Thiodiazotropha taylori]MCG8092586.1 hypothetical protein [Candidatus Thiodiazotropha endolucinida]MCG7880635.1 hypothetical protein [Candidatus Thiodiazotropha taylori]MCG8033421.1 hypothetical protein [Candidatus Thiodiazotropha taylori]MCG8048034.1 hypothetical protein [Candidatus Thiodiazotropha taylori]